MRWKYIFTVYAKELRDLLRDRRTVMSMVIIPTLLMPTLTSVMLFVSTTVMKKARATTPTVMVIGGVDSPKLRQALATDRRINVVPTTSDWRQRITDKQVRAAVEIPAGFDAALVAGQPMRVTIYNHEGEMRSGLAVGALRQFLSEYQQAEVVARLRAHGLPDRLVKPFEVATQNVAPPERVGGNVFGGLIPYFFLILSFTGAMYPAIDLTAGEKERGTMETILCSPVRRIDLVLGKFFMVLTASLATVVCSLGSTLVSLAVGGSVLADAGLRSAAGKLPTIDPLGLSAVVLMVVPMAVLFAAVQFTIALFAKSFKEAQSYVSPLVIVILLPAMIGTLPGVELKPSLALVPILNVSLVSKELVSGIWHWPLIALIFGSTCVYAAAALAVAVRMFNREDVIFRS